MTEKKVTTKELTEEYISKHRAIKDCLALGLVNYSSLARHIARDIGAKNKSSMEAILIAARRYSKKVSLSGSTEEKIISILKKGEMEIKNRVIAVILDRLIYKDNLRELQKKVERKADVFHAVEGSKTITIVTLEKYLEEIKTIFKKDIIRINSDLVVIMIKSPADIEGTPGVAAYIINLFAEHSVNISELMSCWTDTMIVISKKDLSKVMQFLDF